MTLVLAMLLSLVAMTPAFADETPAQGAVSKDTSVSVSGLETGDKVNFIQVIKWVDGTGWAWADGLEAAATAKGVTLPTLTTITGTTTPQKDGEISAEHAAAIAKAASGLSGTEITESSKTATLNNAASGLYYAQVKPASADYLYNTIFVGADFRSDNKTESINAASATLNPTSGEAIAKKEQVTLTKDANGDTDNIKYDHNLGDVIAFTITSKVPAYGPSYENPTYVITDTMETGLVLCKDDGTAASAADITVTIAGVDDLTGNGTDYTVAVNGQTFTVTLTNKGLAKVAALGEAKTITVTYNAKITTLDSATVTEKDNKATVQFSNNPTDKTEYSKLEDKTRHYTFSIDTSLLGEGDYTTSELVKVGYDEDGNEITKVTTYSNHEEHGALEGALFGLYKTQDAAAAGTADDSTDPENKHYNENLIAKATSDGMGHLKFEGLDGASSYYLVELSAPEGYIKDTTVKTITFAAEYDEVPGGTYVDNGVTIKYDAYKILKGYTVTVSGGNPSTTATSSYTILNNGTKVENKTTGSDVMVNKAEIKESDGKTTAGDQGFVLKNTKGTELPSTGGMGTTILYTVGGILIAAGGIWLVTKKRLSAME